MISNHASEKARDIRSRYGPNITYPILLAILKDRRSVRYPVEIRFVSEGIQPGMFARTDLISDDPEEGYVISLHSTFEGREDILPSLILYQLVLVNYNDLATANDAEIFASTVLGIKRDAYYEQIVSITDTLWAEPHS